MATLRQYFDTDFSQTLTCFHTRMLRSADGVTHSLVERMHLDFPANARFSSYFIADCEYAPGIPEFLVPNPDLSSSLLDDIEVSSGYMGTEMVPGKSLVFTRRLTLYIDRLLTPPEKESIVNAAKQGGVAVSIRDHAYLQARQQVETPLAFICHDSRDKDAIARPLAIALSKLMCPVWFDEFSLKVGDSLRESVEDGLKKCKKCILIVSENFLTNTGWTKTEFNAIFTREIMERKTVMLPVWNDVTKEAVYQYSPTLADRLAANWSKGADSVAAELRRSIV